MRAVRSVLPQTTRRDILFTQPPARATKLLVPPHHKGAGPATRHSVSSEGRRSGYRFDFILMTNETGRTSCPAWSAGVEGSRRRLAACAQSEYMCRQGGEHTRAPGTNLYQPPLEAYWSICAEYIFMYLINIQGVYLSTRRVRPAVRICPSAQKPAKRRHRPQGRHCCARARPRDCVHDDWGRERRRCELTGFFPRIDRIFPSSTSKRYSKGKGLGFRAENLGVG